MFRALYQKGKTCRVTAKRYHGVGDAALFDGPDEIINLVVPFIFFGALVAIRWLIPDWANLDFDFFARIVFFNGTHTVLTVLMILGLPELRRWEEAERRDRGFNIWQRGALVFFFMMALVAIGRRPASSNWPSVGVTLYLGIALPFALRHATAQIRGLSFCHNAGFLKSVGSPQDLAEIIRLSQTLEKWGGRTILVFWSFWLISVKLNLRDLANPICLSGMLLGFALILASCFVLPNRLRRRKLLFQVRILPIALEPLFPLAFAAYRSMHGIEYILVFRKMTGNSQIRPKAKFGLYFLAVLGMCAVAVIIRPAKVLGLVGGANGAILVPAVLILLNQAHDYLHYYWDGVLFAMRSPATRSFVAPLLAKGKRAESGVQASSRPDRSRQVISMDLA